MGARVGVPLAYLGLCRGCLKDITPQAGWGGGHSRPMGRQWLSPDGDHTLGPDPGHMLSPDPGHT